MSDEVLESKKPDLVSKAYSISQINMYLTCPQRWYLRYVKGITAPFQPGAFANGTATHSALEYNFRNKVYTGKDLPPSEVADAFVGFLESSRKVGNYDWDNKYNQYKEGGVKVLREYVADHAKPLQPKLIEQEIEFTIPGFEKPIVGVLDLVTSDLDIIDFKTIGKTPSIFEVKKNLLQLTCYAYGMEALKNKRNLFSEREERALIKKKEITTRLDFLVNMKTKTAIVTKQVSRTKNDLERFVAFMNKTCEAMRKKIVYPNWNSTLCSQKYCSWWDACNEELKGQDSYMVMLKEETPDE